MLHPPPPKPLSGPRTTKTELAQRRFNLKGRVNTLYNRLLAELRWSILTLETQWLNQGHLSQAGDIFFLTLDEIKATVMAAHPPAWDSLRSRIADRRDQFRQDQRRDAIPYLVFGNDPPSLDHMRLAPAPAYNSFLALGLVLAP